MLKVTMVLAAVLSMSLSISRIAQASELAKVNGRSITDKDLQSSLGSLNEGQRSALLKDPSTRRQILVNLIDQELLMGKAEEEKLDQDAEYKQAVSNFRRQFLVNRILEKSVASKVNEKAAKKYYDVHKHRFSTDQVEVQHILLDTEQAANDMLKKAKEPGADFQELAEKNSKDPSAKNNRGEIGMINRDSPFVDEFKEAAFAAKEGEIVGPVKTDFGYHLIKVVKKKGGRALSYDEVEMKVKGELRHELVQQYVAELKKGAKISIDDKALDKL